ncbi:glyoxal oxidase [Serendipita vermifera MAFF 305830]|uniref:Glyoxal oxidase n=1 Tax=Serendipita vermifera MAFF 305830 TaxID=933852 RepID=A0A0C2XDS2_SERVB|nr:glyoxal oxidase [Serendipita vermifera MAFF 305830]
MRLGIPSLIQHLKDNKSAIRTSVGKTLQTLFGYGQLCLSYWFHFLTHFIPEDTRDVIFRMRPPNSWLEYLQDTDVDALQVFTGICCFLIGEGQPTHTISDDLLGGFQVVGESGVSAQQLFLGSENLVYILDKVENNPLTINNHAAWGTVYDIDTNIATPLEVTTNTFCAGGAILGNGDWVSIGGNQAVDPGGNTSTSQTGNNTYQNSDGAFAVRTITPGPEGNWYDDPAMDLKSKRWYPTLEPMIDGRAFVLGGDQWGGFVNDVNNSNPTYEFWPRYDGETSIGSPILLNTLPANLYPIAHLLPSNTILLNINRAAAILDTNANAEYPLPEVPHAVRTYPASASSVLLPLTPANGWNATVMYCGGSDISKEDWLSTTLALISVPASASCIKISPATQNDFEDEDSLPVGRVMGSAILLPDGTVLVVNGANTGVAGYAGNAAQQAWSVDDGFSDMPVLRPIIYDPSRPSGQKWSDAGLQESTVPRMYHSSATLLPDGSVLVAGSNPHPDYSPNKTYPTEYRVERFYPLYYNKRRPEPSGIPSSISYGGSYFELGLTLDDLFGDVQNLNKLKIVLMKTGYSTHAINFGMRSAELDHTFTLNADSTGRADGSAGITLHVSQAPPNVAILPPGTAWFFVVVDGVPSVGAKVMVGTGQIGNQPTADVEALPESSTLEDQNWMIQRSFGQP